MTELFINESMRSYCTMLFRGQGLQADPETVQLVLQWAEFYFEECGMKPLNRMADENIIAFYYRIVGNPTEETTEPDEYSGEVGSDEWIQDEKDAWDDYEDEDDEPQIEEIEYTVKLVAYEVVESDGYHIDRIQVFLSKADAQEFCDRWNEHSWYEARVRELEIF